ncbi:T9SS type A sorting domain-containing protein [Ichthyenterobacterium sp. W332]|uniref:T9SS type A sorting domain-containing protein n=1 Tax=Microcosmobacter mediterraneus TaxID=3075607 RepID=A0ABU2YJM5_9FLAO|nr:T9SS type A sorting domain-containing protein [Ichthyenterobacterium sp. W332]MDT0558017.1 T9SS type A sorting domain-containing protein [Ichthyenterobacterium sp. W332]
MKQFYTLILVLISITLHTQQQIGQDINGAAAGDNAGISVSTSADGNIVAIGSPFNDENGLNSGHVRIFENQSDTWVQIGQDIEGEAEGDRSGISVSLSADGSIVAIGAQLNDGNGIISGHVRIYENLNGTWIQIGQDIDGEAAEDASGQSISLSADGSIVAIGAQLNDGSGFNSGHVRIYENQNGTWIQIGQDIDGDDTNNRFGRSVSLSANGNIVAINLIGIDEFGFDSVRVYENQSGTWTQIGDDINGESLGAANNGGVSLSSNGNIVAFLALGLTDTPEVSNVAVIYENQNGTWVQLGDTIFSEQTSDGAGTRSISLSGDGTIVAIGANTNDGNGINSGHVRVFKNQNGVWMQLGEDIDGGAASDFLGASVSLSENGNILAIGAYGNDDNGDLSGQVTVFDLFDLLSTDDYQNSEFKLYPNPAKNQFTIQLNDASILESITVYNALGQAVLTSTKSVINTSKLASGSYIVEVLTSKGKDTKKLIIE